MSDGGSKGTSKIWTVSNIITITRILLVPVFVAALLAPWPEWFGMNAAFSNDWKSIIAAAIFVLISCTDWLDGYLARSRNEVTDFGKFMDPLADKILVAAALIALVELKALPTWVVLVILAREFIVSGVRMTAASKGVVIAASMLGKFKTVFQMIAIVLFTIKDSHMIGTFGDALSDVLWDVSWLVMLIAVFLTVASMIDYLLKARELLGFGQQDTDQGQQAPDAQTLAAEVVEIARKNGKTFTCAESLTGGLIGATITAVPGASEAFKGGIISYTNEVKHDVLDVDGTVLQQEGAVCELVACEMAQGACDLMKCDAAVAVTGIAGPTGAEPGKPVGTVWVATSMNGESRAVEHHFKGTREEVRMQTAATALESLKSIL